MAKYNEVFKIKAVALLSELVKDGEVQFKGLRITNVRQLVSELGCSSFSIYKWTKDFSKKIVCENEGFCKAYQSNDDEGYGTCNMFGKCDDFREVKRDVVDDFDDDFFDDKDIEISIPSGEKKDIFGIRYYSWFARNLGVKNYSSMVLAQLKLSIGLKLIEQSGVVDMNKAMKKLKQNGEGL